VYTPVLLSPLPTRDGGTGARVHELPTHVLSDLRTDHAGETGAVFIYLGILFAARDPGVRAFACRHLATEQAHLELINAWLPLQHRSKLLPVWRVAGWLTGALPALAGPRALYATIEAVERFVDVHYSEQVHRLSSQPEWQALRETLLTCQRDEVAHMNEATAARGPQAPRGLLSIWCRLVNVGSRAAVGICRHI
jgi:3-demethoxyubiquinol 3-hydroxylase